MSDFVNGFWSVYVALLTLVSVVGCGVFLWVQSKAKATAASSGEVKTMGHVWDEDLEDFLCQIEMGDDCPVMAPDYGALAAEASQHTAAVQDRDGAGIF